MSLPDRSFASSKSCSACPASAPRARSGWRFTFSRRRASTPTGSPTPFATSRSASPTARSATTSPTPIRARICSSEDRDRQVICVVEEPQNVSAIEKTREFKGMYHVLMGALSPLQGIGPDDLKIKGLLSRVDDGVDRNHPRDESERRRRSHGDLPGAAAQAARRQGHAHRHGRAGRQRSRIRRRSDDAQGDRRTPRGLGPRDAAARAYELPAALLLVPGRRRGVFCGLPLFRSCSAIYGFILGAMLASSMMGSQQHRRDDRGRAGRRAGRRAHPGLRLLRRHRAGRRRPWRAGRARRLELRSRPGDPPGWWSSCMALVGAHRRDGPAALRHHRVARRSAARGRSSSGAGDDGDCAVAAGVAATTCGSCIRRRRPPVRCGCRSRGSCSGWSARASNSA